MMREEFEKPGLLGLRCSREFLSLGWKWHGVREFAGLIITAICSSRYDASLAVTCGKGGTGILRFALNSAPVHAAAGMKPDVVTMKDNSWSP